MFNKIILAGNLTRDIEIKRTVTGMSIVNTCIATNRKFKNQNGEDKEEVMFLDMTFFGRTAEIAHQYLMKGSKVLVDGRLKLDQWTDASGQKRSKHSLVVESMKMLGGGGPAMVVESYNGNSGRENNNLLKTELNAADYEMSISEEDMPF